MHTAHSATKILIIRLSSFGDIVQTMSVLGPLAKRFPLAQIDWLVRSDNQSVLSASPLINRIWSFERASGLGGLLKLALALRQEGYTHVYDAHSNLRSRLVSLFLWPTFFARRSKERLKRVLLFKFQINKFPSPYQGMKSYMAPLKPWGIEAKDLRQEWEFKEELKKKVDALLGDSSWVTLVPSAAWEMKRWPLSHWEELIKLCPQVKFLLLGGPTDYFLADLAAISPERVLNLAGKLSLVESCYAVRKSCLVIANDTGLLHVADLLGVPALALMGPTAFGFPTHEQVQTLEVSLPCRPCTKDGRGTCIQSVYQKCLVDITAKRVAQIVNKTL